MISRDTAVHISAVLLAYALLLLVDVAGVLPEGEPLPVAVAVLFYGLILGGAHLYLAIRGEDGIVPVDSRWRFVAMLAVVLATAVAIDYAGDLTIASVELRTIGLAVIAVAAVAYLAVESLDGYRATRSA